MKFKDVNLQHKNLGIVSVLENKKNDIPPSICIYYDSNLTEQEQIVRATIESKIAKYTNYNPTIDNRDDRGEVKSLSYIATKQLLYFCSHDSNAIRLVEDAEKLETSLEEVSAIKPYEVIYYFVKNGIGDTEKLRYIYKYLYYLTKNDIETNPSWGEFVEKMDELYCDEIRKG